MSEEHVSAEPAFLSGRRPIYLAAAAIMLGLLLIVAFAILLLRSGDEEGRDGSPEATATSELVGPLVTTPGAVPAADVVVVGISSASTISVSLQSPAMLDVAGRRFNLRAESVPAQGRWEPALPGATNAVWVYGTVVNYVVGLADSAENRALLDSLLPGDRITLTSFGGQASEFAFESRNVVPATSPEVFAQSSPGITLVLLGTAGENRLVAHGRYVVPDAGSQSVANLVELGETAQLDNLQLTATGTTHLLDEPGAPPGFAFFLIDFELRNVGAQAIDASRLRLSLIDQLGNQYATNALASQFGRFPLATGVVGAGQSLQATAGYQIPASLSGDTLRWIVQLGDSGSQIEVNVPFRKTGTNAAIVTVLGAEVSLDGTSLAIQGQVTNLGAEQLVIASENVRLSGGGTVYFLFANNPAFPWVLPSQQSLSFTVTFQRPQEAVAVLEVLNYPFELTGLR